ncbi:MAG TPA: bile acid:sodium symporter family protein [Gammaproteobacteria bacterium]|jgi:BASS family bile acid:Na+ symporter|nr:bile acid:sodium symporter family protein [Gammaproteobacteria bacterium]
MCSDTVFFIVINKLLTHYFALWVILVSVIACLYPAPFLPIKSYIVPLLGLIMFGMGMTLRVEDFRVALLKPVPVFIGVTLQYLAMPALGFGLAVLLKLPPDIAAGLVLVGACPGGTASNVMVYLARGNVALSVAMTTVSTLLAPLLTPYLMLFYAERWLPVDPVALFVSILKIVLVPVILGVLVKRYLPKAARSAEYWTPSVSVLAIIAIIACVVALNVDSLLSMGLMILLAVVFHNLLGLLMGYTAARFFGQSATNNRAIALEVGMQNSGLGATLAYAHFSPLAALPSAVFSVWHNLSGALLVSFWNRKKSSQGEGG